MIFIRINCISKLIGLLIPNKGNTLLDTNPTIIKRARLRATDRKIFTAFDVGVKISLIYWNPIKKEIYTTIKSE
jgi:hypothetical protein